MAERYKGSYRDQLDITEEETPAEQQTTTEDEDTTPPTTAEEVTFKKRYGDLRRYMAAEKKAWEGRENEFKRQLAELTTQTFRLPKNEQELDQFYKQYPDGAAFIETIAAKIADRKVSELGTKYDQQITELEKAREATVKERAYAELLKLQPEFEKIIADKKFQEWIDKQPQRIQDSLFKNDTDPEWASRTIDMYNLEAGDAVVRKVTKGKTEPSRERQAAAHVAPNNVAPEPTLTGDGKKIWRESEIKALGRAGKFTDEIDREVTIAMAEGRVIHDVTPPRRGR